jgi:hypothetical protein
MATTISKWRSFLASLYSPRRGRKQQPARRRLWLEELEPRMAPATVQFSNAGETINATAGSFSVPVTLAGTSPPTISPFASGFDSPQGLAFDTAGNLYVANYNSGTVSKVTPTGTVSTFASGLGHPDGGLAFDAAGNLYVADFGNNLIRKVTPAGVVSTFVFNINNPAALAFDAAGNLYVANLGNTGQPQTVSKVTPAGVVSIFASGFLYPTGLAFDSAGNLYVANENDANVEVVNEVTPAGVVSTFASGFTLPDSGGLAFDAAGNLYVGSYGDGTVSQVTPAGVVSTFASGFNQPWGLAFDAAGNLYVANNGDNTVSKVSDAVSVPFTLGGTAVSGTDYSGVTASPLVFASGQTSATISGTLLSDPGPDQTLTFTLGTPSGGATLGSPSVNTLTIDEPDAIAAASGGGQSATVNTAFASPLVATVTDASGAPLSGVTVTFAGPASGAGVTFSGGNTATTDAQGRASINITANAGAGSYAVTGSVSGVATAASFALTNNPGAVSLSQSIVTVSPTSIESGNTATVTLTAEDASGNQETSGGLTVSFGLGSGNGSGTFGPVADHGNGLYTATFTATTAGTIAITSTIGGQPVGSTAPIVTVTPGPVNLSQSTLSVSSTGLQVGGATTVTLTARDADGNQETGGGLMVAFALGTSTGSGTISAVTDNGNGTYTATLTGTTAGNLSLLATINNQPLPITVSVSVAPVAQPQPAIAGPADITTLVDIHLGPLTPVRKGRRKVPGRFQQTVTIVNKSADLIEGSIALVLDNLKPQKRVRHRLVSQVTLLNATGTTRSNSPGSPFRLADAPTGQLQPMETVTLVLDFHTKEAGKITFIPIVLVGFSQP